MDTPAPRRRAWPVALVALVALAGIAVAITVVVTSKSPSSGEIDAGVGRAHEADATRESPQHVAGSPPDAAVEQHDANVIATARDAAPKPRDVPAGTVIAAAPTGKPCACELRTQDNLIDRACARLLAEPRCSCNEGSTQLCPFVLTVTEGTQRMPDGTQGGKMNCVDRTRPECDPTSPRMPSSCNATLGRGVDGAACSGYATGQVEGDPKRTGTYACSRCDWATSAPKFYGSTGDTCIGYSRAGEKVRGTLRCWN